MSGFLRSLLIGALASLSLCLLGIALARISIVPLRVYLAPAAVIDYRYVDIPLRRAFGVFFPEGGPTAVFVTVMGGAFAFWTFVFALLSHLATRRRTVV
jgi:hypothetical protein